MQSLVWLVMFPNSNIVFRVCFWFLMYVSLFTLVNHCNAFEFLQLALQFDNFFLFFVIFIFKVLQWPLKKNPFACVSCLPPNNKYTNSYELDLFLKIIDQNLFFGHGFFSLVIVGLQFLEFCFFLLELLSTVYEKIKSNRNKRFKFIRHACS